MNCNFGRDIFDSHALNRPNNTALYIIRPNLTADAISFSAMRDISNRTVGWLREHGISKGQKVLVILGKDPAFWPIMLGLLKLGAIPIPGTTQLTRSDLLFRIKVSEANGIIVLSDILERLGGLGLPPTSVFAVGPPLDPFPTINPYTLDGSSDDDGNPTDINDPALIYFTSGTTGHPKMVLHDHGYPKAHKITADYWLDLNADDRHWNISDTGWAKAAWSSLFAPWLNGAAIVVDPFTGKFNPQNILNVLTTHHITSLCAPPTVYRLLVQCDVSEFSFPDMRSAVAAGEPLNPEVIDKFQKMFGLPIRDGYGQTETVVLVANTPTTPLKPGSMGKPLPPFNVAVIDDNGDLVPDNQEGNIAVKVGSEKPPGLFDGYINDPDATANRFIGSWYTTGDRAICDSEGYFWFVGRADDVIISAGYRIGPFEVESALIEHPEVVEAAVVSSPDPIRGEIVKAFVILRAGSHPSEQLVEQLQEHVKKTTAPYKYPRQIAFVHELPKTISGKIRRIELREQEWASFRQKI